MYTSVVFHFDFVSMGIMQANDKKCGFTDIERHLEKKKTLQKSRADFSNIQYANYWRISIFNKP